MNNNSEEKHRKDLEAAKNWYKIAEQQNNEVAMNILKDLFPELNENGDIGTQLANSIKSSALLEDCLQKYGFKINEVTAWLENQDKQNYIDADEDWYEFVRWFVKERTDNYTLIPSDDDIHYWGNIILHHAKKLLKKQGENHIGNNNEMVKPSDEIGPKFKVGDFILNGDITNKGEYEIFKILKVCSQWYDVENIYDGRQTMITFAQEYTCRLWTVEDAKNGDVLAYPDGTIVLFKYRLDGLNSGIYMSHILLATKIETCQSCAISKDLHPATKKQCYLLFSKMKEAGYEWDPEKKELKMIKPDFQKIQWKGNNLKEIVEFTGKSPKFNDWFKTWEEYENYVHAHNNIFKLFNEDGSHFEVPVGAWIVKTPDGYNVASKSTFIQNHKWSEEDEYQINTILHGLDLKRELYKNEGNQVEEKRYKTQYDWLKSLKPQNHWKPSEEQILSLQEAVSIVGENSISGT